MFSAEQRVSIRRPRYSSPVWEKNGLSGGEGHRTLSLSADMLPSKPFVMVVMWDLGPLGVSSARILLVAQWSSAPVRNLPATRFQSASPLYSASRGIHLASGRIPTHL